MLNRVIKYFWLLVVFLMVPAALSWAEDLQNQLVVDQAGIFGNDIDRVEEAARSLGRAGADPHIWTIKSFSGSGAANLDQYEKELERRFLAWQNTDGGRKNNLVVMIISMKEREFYGYFGEQWRKPLESQWNRIRKDIMNPRFGDGEFAQGFVDGIEEMAGIIDNYKHPQPSSGPSQAPVVIVQPERKPADLTGLWTVLKWFLAIVVFGALAALLIWMYISRKHKIERCRQAQQAAKIAKQNSARSLSKMTEDTDMLKIKLNAVAGSLDQETGNGLRKKLEAINDLFGKANLEYGAVNTSAGDPENNGLTEVEYRAIEEGLIDNVLKTLAKAASERKKLEQELEDLQTLSARITGLMTAAGEARVKTVAAITLAKTQGYKTAFQEKMLADSDTVFEKSETALKEKKVRQAASLSEEAADLRQKAENSAVGLPERVKNLEQSQKNLKERISAVIAAIENGRKIFDRIEAKYALSSWESVQGNGSEAESRVNQAEGSLTEAAEKSSMDIQEWDEAEDSVKRANIYLDEAESFMRSISTLEKNLAEAERDSGREIRDAENDIAKAWNYIRQYDDDIRESLEDDLRAAEKTLARAKEILQEERPDYLEVVRFAQTANNSADKIYAQSVDEHEAAERLRRKAESQRKSAKQAISKAKEYIEDHDHKVDSDTKRKLNQAIEKLNESSRMNDLNLIIAAALVAQQNADSAYKSARSDVSSYNSSHSSSNSSFGGGGGFSGGGKW